METGSEKKNLNLDPIKARAKARTPGKAAWESVGDKDNMWCLGVTEPEVSGQIVEEYDEATRTYREKPEVVYYLSQSGSDGTFADADFFAHAGEDIDALVHEVERLRTLCGRAAGYIENASDIIADSSDYDEDDDADAREFAADLRKASGSVDAARLAASPPPDQCRIQSRCVRNSSGHASSHAS